MTIKHAWRVLLKYFLYAVHTVHLDPCQTSLSGSFLPSVNRNLYIYWHVECPRSLSLICPCPKPFSYDGKLMPVRIIADKDFSPIAILVNGHCDTLAPRKSSFRFKIWFSFGVCEKDSVNHLICVNCLTVIDYFTHALISTVRAPGNRVAPMKDVFKFLVPHDSGI